MKVRQIGKYISLFNVVYSHCASAANREDYDLFKLYTPLQDPNTAEVEVSENIKLQVEIIGSIRQQPWRLYRKLKLLRFEIICEYFANEIG